MYLLCYKQTQQTILIQFSKADNRYILRAYSPNIYILCIKDLKERQKILRDHYKFDCACPPCSENWPLLASMKEEVLEDTKR